MLCHRLSYWKTTLTGLCFCVVLGGVASYWLFTGDIRVPGLEKPFLSPAGLYWGPIVLLGLASLFCLMVALGGILCLRADSRQLASCLDVRADTDSGAFSLPKPFPDNESRQH